VSLRPLDLLGPRRTPAHILCLGAHSDDLEIGCAGTLLRLLEADPKPAVTWVVFSGDVARAAETRRAARALLGAASALTVETHEFRDGFFQHQGAAVKETFEALKARLSPDLVFTHHRHDLHQDHRYLCELTWNTFRNHLVLEYEIPKFDGDLGAPNVFVPLSEDQVRAKVDTLLTCFPSQSGKRWFTEDLFRSLLRIRGMECNSPTGYAEAFHGRKLVAG
jgi:LmbE family N-acetylglucosaminyl deacetylase